MNDIKLLLVKIAVFFLLSWGIIEAIYYFAPDQKKELNETYTAAIIDKYHRLEHLPSPKIVLIAGSNFAYGIHSEMLEKAFHRPVVNMALHYNYGTDFMLKQIRPHLHQGDIVLMGFEYIISSEGSLKEKIIMERVFPRAKNWFTYHDIFEYLGENSQVKLDYFKNLLRKKIEGENRLAPMIEDSSSIFFRNGLNRYGDLVSHYNNPPSKVIPRAEINEHASLKNAIADMNTFTDEMQKIGVKVYYTFPSYAVSSYRFDQKILAKMEKELNQEAHFKVLGKVEDFVFPDSLCQDMVFHLTKKGGEIRTQKIIDLLAKDLK